jgi:hypothetical protein
VICQTGQPVGAARPEKTDVLCEEQLGFGTAKAVIASRAVTVHASTLSAPSQELIARALPMSQPFYFVSELMKENLCPPLDLVSSADRFSP